MRSNRISGLTETSWLEMTGMYDKTALGRLMQRIVSIAIQNAIIFKFFDCLKLIYANRLGISYETVKK